MSSASRASPSRGPPVIDLTVDLTNLDDSPPTSPRVNTAEPPRKRQKLSNGVVQTPTRDLPSCLKAQVKPYLDTYLSGFPAGRVNSSKICNKILYQISCESRFLKAFRDNKGFLPPAEEERLAKTSRYLVYHHASRPVRLSRYTDPRQEFQLSTAPAPSPTPKITPSTSTPVAAPGPTSPWATSATAPTIGSSTPVRQRPTAVPQLNSHRASTELTPGVVSPTNYRTKARARSWKSLKTHKPKAGSTASRSKVIGSWIRMPRRPYLTAEERKTMLCGTSRLMRAGAASAAKEPVLFHVDFAPEEMEAVLRKVQEMCGKKTRNGLGSDALNEAGRSLRKEEHLLDSIPRKLELKGDLKTRDHVAIRNLLEEIADKRKMPARKPQILTLQVDEFDKQNETSRSSQIPALLFAREVDGNRGFGRMRRHINFTNEFRNAREDELELRAEWVNCAGDIMTIAWTSDHTFVCGTTTHSDSHNQQYNRDGNLLLGSSRSKHLKAFADHRIPRPIVEKGENSTEAMRESQSPWLYSSVVSSDYDKKNNRAYTSSFDRTVKVWKVAEDGKNMTAIGTWHHGGNVNFVAASKHESGMVATAADVPTQAVRVYRVRDDASIASCPYESFSGSRSWNEDDKETTATQKWAYFPATMQWGLAEGVRHLLLVGYSPRSFTGDDNDIPEDKQKTGEICLWNCLTGKRIKVMTASTQNVFEVAWHPTLPVFIVATTPAGLAVDERTKTQIRVFETDFPVDTEGEYSETQCLDCTAEDINELTIKPVGPTSSYVTAACTNGIVYVWDTARGQKPIHALRHKKPIDSEDRGVGVKFTAWGTTADRFYTGGTDGVVKVWNVRNLRQPLVRDLLEAPGCVTCGSFSPDFSKLLVGDATGRVVLLSLDQEDEPPPNMRPRSSRSVRRPLAVIRHEEPPAPGTGALETGIARGYHFLASGQLRRHRDPTVGVVQGPTYSDLGLYRREFHFQEDPTQPLLARAEEEQQENKKMFKSSLRVPRLRKPRELGSAALQVQHMRNAKKDLDLNDLDEITKIDLLMDRVVIEDPIEDQGFDFDWEEE
ncbi:WD repeat protein [Colletotrichum musicola]|uniref:WD repeat protein n=1 Tax=Colletotrichum musicola TaxID=2175873 RepID=A0A8H6K703_9PEZI|nr:WD repeat protein [Colletotrichum musicola]